MRDCVCSNKIPTVQPGLSTPFWSFCLLRGHLCRPSATHLQVICGSYHSIEMYWKIDSDLPQNSALHCCSAGQNLPGPTRLPRIPAALFNSSSWIWMKVVCPKWGSGQNNGFRTLKLIMKRPIWQTHIVLASCVLVNSTTSWFPQHCSKWICVKNIQD